MNALIFVLALLAVPQETFSVFSYCHDNSRGLFESQCVRLNFQGAGEFNVRRRGGNESRVDVSLSGPARERFVRAVTGVRFLADGAAYESPRKVADLGPKRLTVETPAGRREAVYNFTVLKDVKELETFFESLISQQLVMIDLETALQFDRLGIPRLLEQMDDNLKANRFADPAGLIPILDKVEKDQKVLDFAREKAGKLKMRLSR